MIKTKSLWLIGVGVAIAAAYGVYWYFPQAFPIVNVSYTMDRAAALSRAKELAGQLQLGPQDGYTQAAAANLDDQMQVYTELEAGGEKVFQDVITSGIYSPYIWVVRHFKPLDVNEVHFFFTPDGKLYGFQEKIAEKVERPSLQPKQAREIAEKQAVKSWAVPLDQFTLVESSKDTKPNGRTDHKFVYERKERLKDAYYRLTLEVTGDKLTGAHYSVKVPDTFIKKYAQMRSANNTIAIGAFLSMAFFYFIIIGLSSLIIFMRRRWLLWKPAFMLGALIAFLTLAMSLNQLPIYWMRYQTTASYTTFVIALILNMIVSFILNTLVFSYVISIAEGLTRKAFKSKIQFWSLWNKEVAASPEGAGQTAIAYLSAPMLLFYQVLIFMFARYFLGWWYPASSLLDPNILATYFPWLQATSIAVQAGIIEECLFRAFPLGAAALLGERYNKRTLFIAIAFLLQAIIFGAAHANYPAQPAYARLIELIFSSTIWGAMYLRFGLLPGILSHVLFDFIVGTIPLFLVTGLGAFINKGIIICIGLIPALIVLWARFRVGSWRAVPAVSYNTAWQPGSVQPVAEKKSESLAHSGELKPWRMYCAYAIGLAGLFLFFMFAKFKTDAPAYSNTIEYVKAHAKELLAQQQGIVLDESWSTLVMPSITITDEHKFIWQQQGGSVLYKQLLGKYLHVPGWDVKFVRFNGSIEERAEIYAIRLTLDNKIAAYKHYVIAEAPGATLDENAARSVALQSLAKEFALTLEEVQEISALACKEPARTDWQFAFSDKQVQLPHDAQARLKINLIGDTLGGFERLVHVPEEWLRERQSEKTIHQLINTCCVLILIALMILALFLSMRRFGLSRSSMKQYLLFALMIFVGVIFTTWWSREGSLFMFNAQEPFNNQLFRIIGFLTLGLVGSAAASAGFIVASLRVRRSLVEVSSAKLMIAGSSIGCGIAGFIAFLNAYLPSLAPYWGNYGYIASYRPVTSAWLYTVFGYVMLTAGTILILNLFYEIERSRGGKFLVLIMSLVLGFVVAGSVELSTVTVWIIAGIIVGCCAYAVYNLLLKYTVAIVPIITAAIAILQSLQQGAQGLFPSVAIGMLFASMVVAQLAVGWFFAHDAKD